MTIDNAFQKTEEDALVAKLLNLVAEKDQLIEGYGKVMASVVQQYGGSITIDKATFVAMPSTVDIKIEEDKRTGSIRIFVDGLDGSKIQG